tara:strand:+ start:483 stop:641 length:159 start_codon:yes stop_codon:yes gene_type:complete
MTQDSLKINQNKDGSFAVEWDKSDPNWKFMNNLTSKEIQDIIQEAMKEDGLI